MKSNTMQYENDGSIALIEIDVPDPSAGEIQLAGGACGICSWDVATAKLGNKMQPMAPAGHEGIGTVIKVGADVTGFAEGDRVAGGGFASVRNLSVERAYKIPDSDLADQFWIVEPVSCAVTGLEHCRIQPATKVAVIGCGFMGQLLIQGLLHSPLGDLIGIDINQDRLDLAAQMGVGELYNLSEIEAADLAPELKEREVDVVIDTTGAQPGLDLATDIVRRGGIINLFGWIKGARASFDPTKWHLGGFTVINSAPGSRLRDPWPAAIQLIHNGVYDLRSLVTHVVPLEQYPTLMGKISEGEESYVKGVVTLE